MCSLPTMKFNGPAGVAAGAGPAPATTGTGGGIGVVGPAFSRGGPLSFWFLTWIARMMKNCSFSAAIRLMTLRPAVGDAEIANSTVRSSISFGPGDAFGGARGVAADTGPAAGVIPGWGIR